MNSVRNYTLERAGTFADHRKREDVALDFWHACKRAAIRENITHATERQNIYTEPLTGHRFVTVQFPSGSRMLVPKAWRRVEDEPDEPVFELCDCRVIKTVDGQYVAVRE